MISQYLASFEGIETVGLVLLVVSVVSFLAIAVWAVRADAAYVRTMERLPLDHGDTIAHLQKEQR